MGIYIPDMEMPKDGYRQLFLTAEGEVIYFPSTPKNGEVRKRAIVVPNHGDLIERSTFGLTDFEIVMCNGDYKEGMKMLLEKIENAPTVIPASGEE